MLQVLLVLAGLCLQEPTKPPVPRGDEEDVIPGFPDGEIARLPDRIDWNWEKAVTAKTPMRLRIDLAGLWRFAPVLEKEAPVSRNEMGWMKMPELWTSPGSVILDARSRGADGLWKNRPLDKFPFAWVERDLVIRNEDTIQWLGHRNFLVLRGPWADAEVFVSQRFKKEPPPDESKDAKSVHVHVEQVTGVEREGGRWFEISEQLAYPAPNQISLRLRAPLEADASDVTESDREDKSASPYVGIEMLPNGPRVDAIRLRRDPARGEIEATIDLLRPVGYMVLPGPPIKTIPMILKLRLDDADRDVVVRKLDEEIGPIKDNTRRVVLRIPWSEEGQPPPAKSRLRLRMESTAGGIFDEMHPIEFVPAKLDAVE